MPEAGTLQLRDEHSGATRSEPFEILLGADGAGFRGACGAGGARGCSRVEERPLAHDYKELLIPSDRSGGAARYAFEPHALHIWPRGGCMLIALPNTDGSFTATLFLPRTAIPASIASATPPPCASSSSASSPTPRHACRIWSSSSRCIRRAGSAPCTASGWQAAGRVLLLGDAAHAIVPFHGQGLNCGFEDCRLLDRLLGGCRRSRARC